MSFRLIQTHPAGGDACAPYDVQFDNPYTVGAFVNEVLKKYSNEWGDFRLRRKECGYFDTFFALEYKYGELLDILPTHIANLTIESATSYGGWSAMDYNLIIKE